MATHSCILAWRIPWIEKPGRLSSVGPHRAWHSWSELALTYIFICVFASVMSSIVRCLLWSLTPFLIGLFVFLVLNFKHSLYILNKSFIKYVFCKYFLHVCDLHPNCLDIAFYRAKVFNFNDVQLNSDFFHGLSLCCCILKKVLPYPRTSRFSPMLSSRNFIFLLLRSEIHFELFSDISEILH